MKITEIARSFSKTSQEKQFEPINLFASYKAELSGNETDEEIKKISDELYQRAVNDVGVALSDKSYEKWTNPQAYVRKEMKKDDVGF